MVEHVNQIYYWLSRNANKHFFKRDSHWKLQVKFPNNTPIKFLMLVTNTKKSYKSKLHVRRRTSNQKALKIDNWYMYITK